MGRFGRSLNRAELIAYDVIPEQLARKVRVVAIPGLPGRYAAITLGKMIFVARDIAQDGTSELLAHELVHVGQWTNDGIVRFVRNYLSHFATGLREHRSWHEAYRSILAEVEARSEASDWCKRCL